MSIKFIIGLLLTSVFLSEVQAQIAKNDSIYIWVEKQPVFTGGNLNEYFKLNVLYPKVALDSGIEGRVPVRFIIDKNGMVHDPQVLRSVHPALDSEALLQIRNMNFRKPAEIQGSPVSMYCTIYVPFYLREHEPVKSVRTDYSKSTAPKYDGDVNAYISAHLRYPASASSRGIEGVVRVKFVIDEQGNVLDPRPVIPGNAALDAEAVRVISGMGKWIPGIQNGTPVKVYFTLPITFRLD